MLSVRAIASAPIVAINSINLMDENYLPAYFMGNSQAIDLIKKTDEYYL